MTLLFLSSALAQDFAGTDEAGQKFDTPETNLSAEVGGSWATGNSMFYTVNGGVDAGHRWKRNKLSIDLAANLGQSVVDAEGDGRLDEADRAVGYQETARRYSGDLRYDRYVGLKGSLYALAGAFVDPFAGYDFRSHEQVGYSRILVENDTTDLVAELGVDYAQEFYVEGIDPATANIVAARAMVGVSHQLNEAVSFTDEVEVYENVLDFADLRVLNTASLTTALSDKLSLKLSHSLLYDNVPVEGFEALDQTTMVTLVASLL